MTQTFNPDPKSWDVKLVQKDQANPKTINRNIEPKAEGAKGRGGQRPRGPKAEGAKGRGGQRPRGPKAEGPKAEGPTSSKLWITLSLSEIVHLFKTNFSLAGTGYLTEGPTVVFNCYAELWTPRVGNTEGGIITVLLTSYLTGWD